MSKNVFSSKWMLRTTIALSVVGVLALVAWGGAQILAVEVPFEADWASSGHADATAEAFVYWDATNPPAVPTGCAKCHSTYGYQDFLGADGTAAGKVDNAAPIGSTVECVACHNAATAAMDSVVFPSGVEVTGLGREARCMVCHQGRESTVSVNTRITDANVPNDDTVSSKLGFRNVHYFAAAATQFGGVTKGGYQYAGKSYDVKFAHVEGLDACIDCHDSHTLQVKVELCGTCHDGVVAREDLEGIRYIGSTSDYDGDGDLAESIHDEIAGLQQILYGAIQAYAAAGGTAIVYDGHSYPYFFKDANANGQRDEGEVGYNAWTARLVRATYNYQVSIKDPGAFAHNAKYIIQLLYDSIENLDPTLVTALTREDAGHFAGSNEAFRHWDEDGKVSKSCSKCHSATGLPFFLKEGVAVSQPISNGFLCTTCHDSLPEFTRRQIADVTFPSGAKLSLGDDSNLCISCHQGRESAVSVNAKVAGKDPDTVIAGQGFINVHYFAAGATLFGTEAKGAYEYAGKTYKGRFGHVGSFDTCIECHGAHTLEVYREVCSGCHSGATDPHNIRRGSTDYDGDGDRKEGLAGEVETLREALLAAIQNYAATVVGTPITYDSSRYPYFFTATGARYNAFTPRLLKAAYNYQYALKDPGAFAHNGKYILQVLYDSMEDLGANMTGKVRP